METMSKAGASMQLHKELPIIILVKVACRLCDLFLSPMLQSIQMLYLMPETSPIILSSLLRTCPIETPTAQPLHLLREQPRQAQSLLPVP